TQTGGSRSDENPPSGARGAGGSNASNAKRHTTYERPTPDELPLPQERGIRQIFDQGPLSRTRQGDDCHAGNNINATTPSSDAARACQVLVGPAATGDRRHCLRRSRILLARTDPCDPGPALRSLCAG